MKLWRVGAVVAGAAAVAGCATAGLDRMTEYGTGMVDATTSIDGRTFNLGVHPRDNTILVSRTVGAAVGQSALKVATLGGVQPMEPKPVWRRAAEWLAAPAGCTVTDVYTLDNQMVWEAPFTCPPGVDLRELVRAQRASLHHGVQLHP